MVNNGWDHQYKKLEKIDRSNFKKMVFMDLAGVQVDTTESDRRIEIRSRNDVHYEY